MTGDGKDIDDSTAPLIEHLAELRSRLINSLIAFCVAMIAAFAVAQPIFNFLAAPLADLLVAHGQKPELIYTGLQQGFFTQVRISVFGGLLLSFPVISYQMWRFVAPGLYKQEKRAFLPFMVASPVLFIAGCAFAFYVLLPLVYDFFLGFQQFGGDTIEGQDVTIQYLGTINEYLALTIKFMVAFGLCFQLPVALTLMGLAGLVSAKGLAGFRKYALVGMLFVAAFVTPGPDVLSQLILFAAIYPLYEISILLVRFFERKREAELKAQGLWDEAAEENS
jgi:sec-independent protein translocase protein TatC